MAMEHPLQEAGSGTSCHVMKNLAITKLASLCVRKRDETNFKGVINAKLSRSRHSKAMHTSAQL